MFSKKRQVRRQAIQSQCIGQTFVALERIDADQQLGLHAVKNAQVDDAVAAAHVENAASQQRALLQQIIGHHQRGRTIQTREGIARIYEGQNWNPNLRAPLTEPGASAPGRRASA